MDSPLLFGIMGMISLKVGLGLSCAEANFDDGYMERFLILLERERER